MKLLDHLHFPDHLLYWPEHYLWVAPQGGSGAYRVGMTPLGLAVHGSLLVFSAKPPGTRLPAGCAFALLQTRASHLLLKAPWPLEVVESNHHLDDEALAVNADPYGIWLAEVLPEPPAAPAASHPAPFLDRPRALDIWRRLPLPGL